MPDPPSDFRASRIEDPRAAATEQRHVDEVKRLGRDLRHRLGELHGLLDVSPIGLAVAHDPNCDVITANPAFAEMLGGPTETNVSKSGPTGTMLSFAVWKNGIELSPGELPMQRAARDNREIREEELEIRLSSGQSRTLLCYATPLHDERGIVRGVLGAFVDVTDLKEAHRALEEQTRRATKELAERRRAERELRELNVTLEERVRARTDELEQINARLLIEIDERIRTERDLERANAELLRSNRELHDFAHVASHDMKEPLRKISAIVDLLQVDCSDELGERGRGYVRRIQDSALRMAALIEDLLVYSRLQIQVRSFSRVSLDQVARDVLSDLELPIQDTGADVTVGDLGWVQADAVQMRRLFQNLISNSLKFRTPDVLPVIKITAEPCVDASGRGVCRLLFEDNGIGFDDKYLDRIFSPLQRLHEHQAFPGTGMGLAICRRIVERHQGEITARSAPGKGSVFVVALPLGAKG